MPDAYICKGPFEENQLLSFAKLAENGILTCNVVPAEEGTNSEKTLRSSPDALKDPRAIGAQHRQRTASGDAHSQAQRHAQHIQKMERRRAEKQMKRRASDKATGEVSVPETAV